MKSKKLKFTIFSLIVHVLIFILITWNKTSIDAATLGVWFGSFNLTIGIYTGANVYQKKVIGQNYRPELEGL